MIKSNPKLAGYLAIIASEFGSATFESAHLELITGESLRTIQKRLDALDRADFLDYELGENGRKIWRLGQNAACVDLFNPDMPGDTGQNEISVDLEGQNDASDDLDKNNNPQGKNKKSHTLKTKNSTPEEKNSSKTSNVVEVKSFSRKNTDLETDSDDGDFDPSVCQGGPYDGEAFEGLKDTQKIEQILWENDFGFSAQEATNLYTNLFRASELDNEDIVDFVRYDANRLWRKKKAGELNERKAFSLLGSERAIGWYYSDKEVPSSDNQTSAVDEDGYSNDPTIREMQQKGL